MVRIFDFLNHSKLSDTTKGVLSLIGGLFMHLVLGSVYAYGLLSPYMMSLIHSYHPNVQKDDGFILIPIAILSTAFSFSYAGILDKKYGPRM